ncbi:MAG: glycosyltransferase, partial [Opitutales bacterium]
MPVSPLPLRCLPALPSGRPRRLLAVLPVLQPGDAIDRALDIVRHLIATGTWAVRAVTASGDPHCATAGAIGLEVQQVDARLFWTAANQAAAGRELSSLARQIWWLHLDAVVVFDPASAWAITIARDAGLPVLFDVTADTPLPPPAGASAAALLREAWRSATAVCYSSAAAARTHATLLGHLPGEIIPHWHAAMPPAAAGSVCLSTTQDAKPLRAVLDAAAAGIPIVASPTPTLTEYFGPGEITYLSANLELSIAHACLDLAANPAAAARRTEAAGRRVRAEHAPAPLLA